MSEPPHPFVMPPGADQLVTDDGEPMESARHRQQMAILIESLEFAWEDRTDYYVGGNMFLYFSETQTRRNDFRGPDVFVVLNTTRRERKAWVVWEEEGKSPDVIIELLSETTEAIDRGEKMRVYGRLLKVGEYFLFDPLSGVFEGYELEAAGAGYRPKIPDAHGNLKCSQLGLWLGKMRSSLWAVDVDWLRWLDADGQPLPMPREAAHAVKAQLSQALEQQQAQQLRANAEAERANAEAERANAEAERARSLAAELEALRAKQT